MKTARELAEGFIADPWGKGCTHSVDELTKLLDAREKEIGEAAAAVAIESVLESLRSLQRAIATGPKLRRAWKDAPAVRVGELVATLERHYSAALGGR